MKRLIFDVFMKIIVHVALPQQCWEKRNLVSYMELLVYKTLLKVAPTYECKK